MSYTVNWPEIRVNGKVYERGATVADGAFLSEFEKHVLLSAGMLVLGSTTTTTVLVPITVPGDHLQTQTASAPAGATTLVPDDDTKEFAARVAAAVDGQAAAVASQPELTSESTSSEPAPEMPADTAYRPTWLKYAVATGVGPEDELAKLSREDLIARTKAHVAEPPPSLPTT